MLASFFLNAKLMLGSVAALVMGTLYVIFKARGEEINVLNDELEELKQENRVNEEIKVVNVEALDAYNAQMDMTNEYYEETIRGVYQDNDKPLTPSLLSKLRSSQGISDNSNNSSN